MTAPAAGRPVRPRAPLRRATTATARGDPRRLPRDRLLSERARRDSRGPGRRSRDRRRPRRPGPSPRRRGPRLDECRCRPGRKAGVVRNGAEQLLDLPMERQGAGLRITNLDPRRRGCSHECVWALVVRPNGVPPREGQAHQSRSGLDARFPPERVEHGEPRGTREVAVVAPGQTLVSRSNGLGQCTVHRGHEQRLFESARSTTAASATSRG